MSPEEPPLAQAAAIPVHAGKVCLITSSNGRSWIIPKGMIDPGNTAEEAAHQEVWEEAGLRGELSPTAQGSYRYEKWGRSLEVTVFLMTVTDILDDWPEKNQRQRRWVTWAEAGKLVENENLKEILKKANTVYEKSAKGINR